MSYVEWKTVGGIASSWVTSPIIAALLAFFNFILSDEKVYLR